MKFIVLSSALLALSELQIAESGKWFMLMGKYQIRNNFKCLLVFLTNISIWFYYLAALNQLKCDSFYTLDKATSNYDKYCYESQHDLEVFCFGNMYDATQCTDIMVDNIHEGIQFVFDWKNDSPMRFNKEGEGKCRVYHPDYLENLAWTLGYSNYRVNTNKSNIQGQYSIYFLQGFKTKNRISSP